MDRVEHIDSSCCTMFEADDEESELVCPICKACNVKDSLLALKSNNCTCVDTFNKSVQNKNRLKDLMSHIDKVINLTKEYKTEGLISPSIEKFIHSCNEAKEKMEGHDNSILDGGACKNSQKCAGNKTNLRPHTTSSKCVNSRCQLKMPADELPYTDSAYNLSDVTSNKLGYFEKKFKQTVKVTRLKNEDGSISEEKKVVTIKIDMRNPNQMNGLGTEMDENEQLFNSWNNEGRGHRENIQNSNVYKSNPRETKSEHATDINQTCEPIFGVCMTAGQSKETINKGSVRDGFNDSLDKTTCSSKITAPVHEPLESGTTGHVVLSIAKQVPGNMVVSMENGENDKSYLSNDLSGAKYSVDKTVQNKSMAISALWRDAWTSTSDLLSIPSRIPNKKPGFPLCAEANSTSKHSSLTTEKERQAKQSSSYCTVKIISKAAKVRGPQNSEKPIEDPQDLVLSILDTIKKTYMPLYTSIKDFATSKLSRENNLQNICEGCRSKLLKSSMSASQKYQAKAEEDQEAEMFSTSEYPSYSSMSCKGIGVGSAKTASKSVCCSSKKPSSVSCRSKKSTASIKSRPTSATTKDVGTSTRRSTRFDVRPITRINKRKKNNLNDCTCHSETDFDRNRTQREPTRSSRSYNDEYFCKWRE